MVFTGGQLAKKVELYGSNNDGNPISFIVANATQVSKGILLKFADNRTASAADGATAAAASIVAGISAMEKEASDGSTRMSVWTDGIFTAKASGAITTGRPVGFVVDNFIIQLPENATSGALLSDFGKVAGIALQDFTDLEVGEFRLKL